MARVSTGTGGVKSRRSLSHTEAQAVAAIVSYVRLYGRPPTYRQVSDDLLLHLDRDQINAAAARARRKGWDVPWVGA